MSAVRNAVTRSISLSLRQPFSLPQTLILFVTSRCNARCSFCLYWEQINNPVAKREELTPAEIERIARRYGDLHYLALSGGEPFIRKDIGDICQAFIDHSSTAVIDIPSNFYYTDTMVSTMEALVERNPDTVFDLQMSVDHIGADHDASRKVPNLYQRATESFAALAAVRERFGNLRIKVNVVYLESNRDHLEEIVGELSRRFAYDRLQITFPTEVVDASTDRAELGRQIDEFIDHERRAMEHTRPSDRADLYTVGMRSVKSLYHRMLARAVGDGNGGGERNVGSYCEAGRHIVVVNEKGDVFPCEPLWHPVGNLREAGYDMARVLDGDAYRAFRRDHLGPGKCNCTWGCAIHSDISARPKHLPALGASALRILSS